MRLCKQLFSTVTLIAVLALPMAMLGCAETSAPSGATADPGAAPEMGQPEGGSAL